jgi:hypothetical protein
MPMSPRRGRCLQLTIDPDACAILDALAPGTKHRGRLLSELLRQEVVRRQERVRVLQELREHGDAVLMR